MEKRVEEEDFVGPDDTLFLGLGIYPAWPFVGNVGNVVSEMAAKFGNNVLCVKHEKEKCFELGRKEVFDEPKVEFFGRTSTYGKHHDF